MRAKVGAWVVFDAPAVCDGQLKGHGGIVVQVQPPSPHMEYYLVEHVVFPFADPAWCMRRRWVCELDVIAIGDPG